MFIADAQVHIWAPNSAERPWDAAREPHRAAPLEAEELLRLMDDAGVARAVLVPPSWDCDRNDLVLAAARRYPDRFAAMGRPNLAAPDVRDQVARWLDQPGMVGLRASLTLPEWTSAIAEGRVEWLWETAERAGIPLALLVAHRDMHLIDGVAEAHPALKLVLCHLGLPTGVRDAAAFERFDSLLPLAKRPNINVKVSALPAYTSAPYPFRPLHEYIRRVYDAFGPRRMFWGTDLARLPCSYREAITLFTEELPWLTESDKRWMMGRGVCEWLGWSIPENAAV